MNVYIRDIQYAYALAISGREGDNFTVAVRVDNVVFLLNVQNLC